MVAVASGHSLNNYLVASTHATMLFWCILISLRVCSLGRMVFGSLSDGVYSSW